MIHWAFLKASLIRVGWLYCLAKSRMGGFVWGCFGWILWAPLVFLEHLVSNADSWTQLMHRVAKCKLVFFSILPPHVHAHYSAMSTLFMPHTAGARTYQQWTIILYTPQGHPGGGGRSGPHVDCSRCRTYMRSRRHHWMHTPLGAPPLNASLTSSSYPLPASLLFHNHLRDCTMVVMHVEDRGWMRD